MPQRSIVDGRDKVGFHDTPSQFDTDISLDVPVIVLADAVPAHVRASIPLLDIPASAPRSASYACTSVPMTTPSVALCAAASASSSNALPAAVQAISSISHAQAVDLPSNLSVADTFCILAYVTTSLSIVQTVPDDVTLISHLSQSETPEDNASILSRTAFLVGTSKDPFHHVASYASSGTEIGLREGIVDIRITCYKLSHYHHFVVCSCRRSDSKLNCYLAC